MKKMTMEELMAHPDFKAVAKRIELPDWVEAVNRRCDDTIFLRAHFEDSAGTISRMTVTWNFAQALAAFEKYRASQDLAPVTFEAAHAKMDEEFFDASLIQDGDLDMINEMADLDYNGAPDERDAEATAPEIPILTAEDANEMMELMEEIQAPLLNLTVGDPCCLYGGGSKEEAGRLADAATKLVSHLRGLILALEDSYKI